MPDRPPNTEAEQAGGVARPAGTARTLEPGQAVEAQAPAAASARCLDAQRSKEVAADRVEPERTHRHPDGTCTTRFYTEPVNFQATEGSWKPIDTTLVPQGAPVLGMMSVGEEGWETGATEVQIEFAGTADADPVVRMQPTKASDPPASPAAWSWTTAGIPVEAGDRAGAATDAGEAAEGKWRSMALGSRGVRRCSGRGAPEGRS
ncbi:hypothetical protein J2X68_007880 [Streptomyces sp. 3330]|uniref:hypothetical protein n=1 Tax=Streptomyces sp. 3330 TaxID=2817755 RepID=UPI00285C5FF0|nr:hypothetical protein [Streptomyces sp. 3330]MDR6981138.1 hypothetical protein [Streptomyces sp. 3330]